MRAAAFFLGLAEADRAVELGRQALTCSHAFEPYSAFQRLAKADAFDDQTASMAVTPKAIVAFLQEVGIAADHSAVETVVNLYSSKMAGFLDFEDFLRLVLSREASDARFEAAKREVPQDQAISPEAEFLLGRLLNRLGDQFRRIKTDPETQALLSDPTSIFSNLSSRNLDFSGLQTFFKQAGLSIPDKDILSVLRLIDINDDGVVDRAELEYFLSILDVRQNSSTRESLAGKVRMKARVAEASQVSRQRVQATREEVRAMIQTGPTIVRREEYTIGQRRTDWRQEEIRGSREDPLLRRHERTIDREVRRATPDRGVSRSTGSLAKRPWREEIRREERPRPIETTNFARTEVFTPLSRPPTRTEDDFFYGGFRALKPLYPEEPKQDYRRTSAMNTNSRETHSIKKSQIDDDQINESPLVNHVRTPKKTVTLTEERRVLYSRENLTRPNREASLSKSANRRIKESIRTEEVIRQMGDTNGSKFDSGKPQTRPQYFGAK